MANRVMHKLIHYPLCPFSRSIRLALAECGMVVELHEERPWAWRRVFLEINPSGALPVLTLAGGAHVCGAYAISEYLAETEPSGPGAPHPRVVLFPGSAEARAEIRRLAEWFHRKLQDEVSQYLLDEKVFGALSRESGVADPALFRAGRDNLRYHLSYVSHLADRRRWLAGSDLSFADYAAAGHFSALDYLGEMPWEDFPQAKEWYARIKSRPSFRALLADRVPGLPPAQAYANLDF
jgi:glutathione S-transferase